MWRWASILPLQGCCSCGDGRPPCDGTQLSPGLTGRESQLTQAVLLPKTVKQQLAHRLEARIGPRLLHQPRQVASRDLWQQGERGEWECLPSSHFTVNRVEACSAAEVDNRLRRLLEQQEAQDAGRGSTQRRLAARPPGSTNPRICSPAAMTRTSTLPGAADGSLHSTGTNTSGPPRELKAAARMSLRVMEGRGALAERAETAAAVALPTAGPSLAAWLCSGQPRGSSSKRRACPLGVVTEEGIWSTPWTAVPCAAGKLSKTTCSSTDPMLQGGPEAVAVLRNHALPAGSTAARLVIKYACASSS